MNSETVEDAGAYAQLIVDLNAQPDPEPKRTRTTVGKLLQRYQDRVLSLEARQQTLEAEISYAGMQRDQVMCQLTVWREAIAEIERD